MSSLKEKKKQTETEKEGTDLRGTFISVMLLGVILIVSWVGIYVLFMSR